MYFNKIGIGCELLYVYFGYPLFNHGNVSTLIPFFIICTKGFVVVCNDDNKEQYKKEFINIMIERKKLRDISERIDKQYYIHFVNPNNYTTELFNLFCSKNDSFSKIAIDEARYAFNKKYRIETLARDNFHLQKIY